MFSVISWSVINGRVVGKKSTYRPSFECLKVRKTPIFICLASLVNGQPHYGLPLCLQRNDQMWDNVALLISASAFISFIDL